MYVSRHYFHNGLHKKSNMLNPPAKAAVCLTETRQNKHKSQTAQSDKIWFKCKKNK